MLLITGCESEQTNNQTNTQIDEIIEEISVDSIEANVRKLASFHTRHTTSDTASDSVGIGAARRWISANFEQYRKKSDNRLKVKYNSFIEKENSRIDEPTEIVNVIAVLPGTQLESKDRRYVVSGHYDSRVSDVMDDTSYAPGANDNASGTAAVMELARVMSQYEFDATIVFMTVAGKEQGLLGARHYAEKSKKQHRNIAGMFTNDIIGNPKKSIDGSVHDDKVRVFAEGIPADSQLSRYHRKMLRAGGDNDTPSRQLVRFVHRIAENHISDLEVNMIYRSDRYFRSGDHEPFLEEGYPAVRISQPYDSDERQHQDVRRVDGVQYGDLPKFVDYDYLTKITRLNAAVLTTLANAPARPRKPTIEIRELENNTNLKWKPNKEPDLERYEIVWRKTNAPFWQHSTTVSDTTTRYTVEGVSQDNYLFGIRSVDKFGNKSPAAYPLPARE